MNFLKEILGDDLYNQVAEKINAFNGNEANKDKQIKVADLGSGKYVDKDKFEKLETELSGKQAALDSANSLIEDLKKGTKGNEDLQGKIKTYETVTIPDLQKQLQETKIKSALKVSLLEAKALDIDYLTFKLQEKLKADGKTLELDENEKIKGWDDLLSGLKTQLANQFEDGGSKTKVDVQKLPDTNNNGGGLSRADFLKKPYAERAAFANENPEAYKTIMGH